MSFEREMDLHVEDQSRIRAGYSYEEYWGNSFKPQPPTLEEMEAFFEDPEEDARFTANSKLITWKDGDTIYNKVDGRAARSLQACAEYGAVIVMLLPDEPGAVEREATWGLNDVLDERAYRAQEHRASQYDSENPDY